jgi:predicted N-acetyltransferase YhbS
MPADIAFLADCPWHKELVTDWLWQAFGDGAGREFYAAIVENGLRRQGLPITFIALEQGRPVGTVGLWRSDLLSRQDLTPWLAALYIDEAHRGKGLGRQLLEFVTTFSRRAGFHRLYLYAAFTGYYERFGWLYLGEGVEYPRKRVYLYSYQGRRS